MLFSRISIYSISLVGLLWMMLISRLSQTRQLFYSTRKPRCSRDVPHMAIQITPVWTDDDELIRSAVSIDFCENYSIELRVDDDD